MEQLVPQDRMESDLESALDRQRKLPQRAYGQCRNTFYRKIYTVLRSPLVKGQVPAQGVGALDLYQTFQLPRAFAECLENVCIGQLRRNFKYDVGLFGSSLSLIGVLED